MGGPGTSTPPTSIWRPQTPLSSGFVDLRGLLPGPPSTPRMAQPATTGPRTTFIATPATSSPPSWPGRASTIIGWARRGERRPVRYAQTALPEQPGWIRGASAIRLPYALTLRQSDPQVNRYRHFSLPSISPRQWKFGARRAGPRLSRNGTSATGRNCGQLQGPAPLAAPTNAARRLSEAGQAGSGPSSTTVRGPSPTRTMTPSLASAPALPSRWTTPLGMSTKSPGSASTRSDPPGPNSTKNRPRVTCPYVSWPGWTCQSTPGGPHSRSVPPRRSHRRTLRSASRLASASARRGARPS